MGVRSRHRYLRNRSGCPQRVGGDAIAMTGSIASAVIPILPYLIPPMVGAAIGYLTNAVAIRMLFRPLRAYRVFGIRIPLTPGIIPRQRHQLAVSIGRMVATHLLTEDAVRSHTGTPKFHGAVRESVARFTSGTLEAVPSEHSRDIVRTVVAAAESTIDQVVEKLLHSEPFIEGVGRATHNAAVSITGASVSTYLPLVEDRLGSIVDSVCESLGDGAARGAVLIAVDRWISEQLRANTPVRSLLPDRFAEMISQIVSGAYEPTVEHAIEWIRTPEVRAELSRHGRVILRRIIEKLSVVQRFFVSAAQYDRQLEERMPEIIDDLIATAEAAAAEPDNRRRVIDAVVTAVEKIRAQGIADAAFRGGVDLNERGRQITTAVLDFVADTGVRERIREAAQGLVSRLEGWTVGRVLQQVLGIDEAEIAVIARERVVAAVRRPDTIASLSREVHVVLDRLFNRLEHEPLGAVVGITTEQKQRLDHLLSNGIGWIIDRRLPEIVQTLDVEQMVIDKVDSLDVAQVEELLLLVIARHLKYINLFGALLGAIIGASQIVISRLW
ncbi:MAG: DUF445 family protein [Spirochaetaceae bacterium]|nr:MAG: DUF445 family protein [Spirochaetaceae bacterium]